MLVLPSDVENYHRRDEETYVTILQIIIIIIVSTVTPPGSEKFSQLTSLLGKLLTPWNRVLLEKLTSL
jgi:hypothetical protein